MIWNSIKRRVSPLENEPLERLVVNEYDILGTTLENDMSLFLKNGGTQFCDINLVLEGQAIPAHKSILAARCSYFQAMFRSFMPPDNTVNVSVVSEASVTGC